MVPKATGELLTCGVVVEEAFVTLSGTVPEDDEKSVSPTYDAVTVSEPTGALVAVHEPAPATRVGVVHNVVAPPAVVKVTVPVGVPPAEVTVTE